MTQFVKQAQLHIVKDAPQRAADERFVTAVIQATAEARAQAQP